MATGRVTAVELPPVCQFDRAKATTGKSIHGGCMPSPLLTPHAAYTSERNPLPDGASRASGNNTVLVSTDDIVAWEAAQPVTWDNYQVADHSVVMLITDGQPK